MVGDPAKCNHPGKQIPRRQSEKFRDGPKADQGRGSFPAEWHRSTVMDGFRITNQRSRITRAHSKYQVTGANGPPISTHYFTWSKLQKKCILNLKTRRFNKTHFAPTQVRSLAESSGRSGNAVLFFARYQKCTTKLAPNCNEC